jgi:signal transduction histidine kinase
VFGTNRRIVRHEKLVATLLWSVACVAASMSLDYIITIALLHNDPQYTPWTTLIIASIVVLPTAYALVSGRVDLRRARDDLLVARDAAVHANLAKSQFFSNMSHELRTPLNAILGFSELLMLDLFANKRLEYAQLVHGSAGHMLNLVNDLLDLSRIEAGKFELTSEAFAVQGLIEECAATVEHKLRAANLVLTVQIQSGLPNVVADRRALKQILLNLLTNAIKFSRPRGPILIFARLTPTGEFALGVKDEGIGIAEKDIGRVFERYGQVRHDIVGVEKGTGLGLPIVKGLTEAHGGRVEMLSGQNQGTCVTILLPQGRLEAPAPVALVA